MQKEAKEKINSAEMKVMKCDTEYSYGLLFLFCVKIRQTVDDHVKPLIVVRKNEDITASVHELNMRRTSTKGSVISELTNS